LPAAAAEPAAPLPSPAALRRSGLPAAGLADILGGKTAPVPEPAPMEGLTAVSAASAPVEPPPEARVTPPAGPQPAPPYPRLDGKPTPPRGTGPIQIEREPVAADPSFGIPQLPRRDAPRPVKAPAPEPFVARPTPPPAAPPAAVKPAASA